VETSNLDPDSDWTPCLSCPRVWIWTPWWLVAPLLIWVKSVPREEEWIEWWKLLISEEARWSPPSPSPTPPSMPICHATLSLKPDKRWCSPFPPLLSLQAKNSNSTQSLISPHQIAVTLCKISDLYQLSLDPNQHPVGSQMFVDWISRSLPQLTEQIPILPFFSGPPAPLSLLHTI
jgi:hypothetical protein